MKQRRAARILMVTGVCAISGAISGYVLVGPGAGQVLALPIALAMGGGSSITLPVVWQFFSPGIVFGLLFSIAASVGAKLETGHVSLVHTCLTAALYTVTSTAIWFVAYWVVVFPYNSGLRNLVLPGAVAGLCGGFLLSLTAIFLPNVKAQTLRWTSVVGAAAGLLFFLNPAIINDLASDSPAYPVLAWCISFALWQGAVGGALAMSAHLSTAPKAAVEAIAPVPPEASRPIAPEKPAAEESAAHV